MPRKPRSATSIKVNTSLSPPVPSLKSSRSINFEAPDPADVFAQQYRQSLPPHPAQFQALRRAPPPPPSSSRSNSSQHQPREKLAARPKPPREMRPLAEIGRHTSPSSKQLARMTSNGSTHTARSLPKIEEVPDLDWDDSSSVKCPSHSRSHSSSSTDSSSSTSSSSTSSPISSRSAATSPVILTGAGTDEYQGMDAREAAIRASIERTSWMIDDDDNDVGKGRGSKDLVEHINYVMSAWQREKVKT